MRVEVCRLVFSAHDSNVVDPKMVHRMSLHHQLQVRSANMEILRWASSPVLGFEDLPKGKVANSEAGTSLMGLRMGFL